MRGAIFFCLLICFSSCNEGWDCTQREGDRVRTEIDIPQRIKQVLVFDDVNMVWHHSQEQRFEIETGENLVDEIILEVVGDSILEVRNENSCRFTRSPRNVFLHVYSDQVNYVEKFGFGEITSGNQLQFDDRVDVVTRGSGNVSLDLISTDNLFIIMRSLSNVTLTGEVRILHVIVDPRVDGILDATNLIANNINFGHSGTNTLKFYPVNLLRGTLRSFGDVIVLNEPTTLEVEELAQGRLIPNY